MNAENIFSLILMLVVLSAFGGMFWYLNRLPQGKAWGQSDNGLHNPLSEEALSNIQFSSSEGIKALEILGTDGHKTAPQLAEAMGISVQVAVAIMRHLGKSYLVQSKTLSPWDFSGGQEVIPETFHITALGYQSLEQFE